MITNITVSHSVKTNHALYGGNQYESSDDFVSLSAEIDESMQLDEVTRELQKECKRIVLESQGNTIQSLQGGMPWDEYKKIIYDISADRLGDPDGYFENLNAMSPRQKQLIDEIRRGKKTGIRDKKG